MARSGGATKAVPGAADGIVVVTRVVAAPRDRVFQAWIDPARLKKWWAPDGFTTPHCSVDLRPGGRFVYCMRTPQGQDIWGVGVYREIVPGRRITYVDSFADANGNPVPATHYGLSADHPLEALVAVTFDDVDGKTRIVLRHEFPRKFPELPGVQQGWGQMLDRLRDLLEPRP